MNNDLLARRLRPPSPAPATPIFGQPPDAQAHEPAPPVIDSAAPVPDTVQGVPQPAPTAPQPAPTEAPLVFADPAPTVHAAVAAEQQSTPLADQHVEYRSADDVAPPADLAPPADSLDPFVPAWEGLVEPAWDSFDLEEAASPGLPLEATWEVDEDDHEDAPAQQPVDNAEPQPATAEPEVGSASGFGFELTSPITAPETDGEVSSPAWPADSDPRLALFAAPTDHTNGHARWPIDTLDTVAAAEPMVTADEHAPGEEQTLAVEPPQIDDSPFTDEPLPADQPLVTDEPPLSDQPLVTYEPPSADHPPTADQLTTDMSPALEAEFAEGPADSEPPLHEPLVEPQIFETPPPPDEPADDLLFGSWRREPRGASVFGDMFAARQAPSETVRERLDYWPPVPIDALPLHDRPAPNGELELPGELAIAWPDTPRAQTFWPDLPADPSVPPAMPLVAPPAPMDAAPTMTAAAQTTMEADPPIDFLAAEPQPAPTPAFIPPPEAFGEAAGYSRTVPSLIFTDLPAVEPQLPSLPSLAQPEPTAQDSAFARFSSQASAFAERIPDHWSLMTPPMATAGDEAAVHEPWHVQASALTVVMAIAVIGLVLTFIYLFTPLMR